MTPPPISAPPPIARPTQASGGLSPLAIVAIGAGAFVMLLAVGVLVLGVFVMRKHAQARAEVARQVEMDRAMAMAAEARATQPRAPFAPGRNEPGLSYTNVRFPSEPWSIHVIKIDRAQKDLTFFSAHARNKVLGVGYLADQARSVPRDVGRALAGLNGDFYLRDDPTYGGDPRGLQIMNGDLISGPSTVCVWFDEKGDPHLDEVKGNFSVTWAGGRKTSFSLNQRRTSGMTVLYTPSYGPSTRASGGREIVLEAAGEGAWLPLQAGEIYRAKVRSVSTEGNTPFTGNIMVLSVPPDQFASVPEVKAGDLVEISTATTPSLKGVKTAIAGGPAIIQAGKPFSLTMPPPGSPGGYSEMSKYQRHPRSAVGWGPTHVFFVVVDGRQPGLSVGMKLAELAKFMGDLGCTDAMNLDGGKSSQLWMTGRTMNSPCQGEDTVANALFVVRKPEGQ